MGIRSHLPRGVLGASCAALLALIACADVEGGDAPYGPGAPALAPTAQRLAPAAARATPWRVLVVSYMPPPPGFPDTVRGPFCEGILISDQWVLSSGTCGGQLSVGTRAVFADDFRAGTSVADAPLIDGFVRLNDSPTREFWHLARPVKPEDNAQPLDIEELGSLAGLRGVVSGFSGSGASQRASTTVPVTVSADGVRIEACNDATHLASGAGVVVRDARGADHLLGVVDQETPCEAGADYPFVRPLGGSRRAVWTVFGYEAAARRVIATPLGAHTYEGGLGWQDAGSGLIDRDVDTRFLSGSWRHGAVPFFSIGGTRNHQLPGMSNLVRDVPGAHPGDFRVYVTSSGLTASIARNLGWYVNWTTVAPGAHQGGVCAGSADATGWVQVSPTILSRDIDTSSCGYADTPLYFANLSATDPYAPQFAKVVGAHAIYRATARGFRVYVTGPAGALARARSEDWRVGWMAFAPDSPACHGRVSAAEFRQDAIGVLHVDVDTSACGFPARRTPHYFTSLGGTSLHGGVLGATSIVNPTATSFRVVLYGGNATAGLALQQNWQLEWVAAP